MTTDNRIKAGWRPKLAAPLGVPALAGPKGAPRMEPTRVQARGRFIDREPEPVRVFDEADRAMLGYFGSDSVFDMFVERLALLFGLSDEDASDGACVTALAEAAQLCLRYGFMPKRHVYIERRGKEWLVDVNMRGWLDSANEYARQAGFTFFVDLVELESDEVQALTPPEVKYSPKDCGCAARILRPDVAQMYATMQAVYDPKWSYGFWREFSFREKLDDGKWGDWQPDPIWYGRGPEDTAKNRATKAALMEMFSLYPLASAYSPRALLEQVDAEAREAMRRRNPPIEETAMFYQAPDVREPDGDVVYA